MGLRESRRDSGPGIPTQAVVLACAAALAVSCRAALVPSAHAIPSLSAAADAFTPSEEIVTRTNAERKLLGLLALARSSALMNAAQLQANQMAAFSVMAHDLPGAAYPSLGSRLGAVGYRMRASGENVAEGYPTAAAVVAGWMTSPAHRANIVSASFTEIGAGVATSKNGRRFYAQVFAQPR